MAQRILVVEDNADLRGFFGDALTVAGFHVVDAADGVEALRHLHQARPDLVVLDLRLPRLNGLELRESLAARQIPIVVVSGSPQDLGDLTVECVLTKPVMPETLVDTVRRCLASAGVTPHDPG